MNKYQVLAQTVMWTSNIVHQSVKQTAGVSFLAYEILFSMYLRGNKIDLK
jgi:hypothetical protein